MNRPWSPTKLYEVLTPVLRAEPVEPTKEYRLLGIRLEGAGPFHRETIMGSQSAATTLYKVKSGDFIYSRLIACRGAFGVIDSNLDGCFVSGEFPTFTPGRDKVDVNFLRLWFRLPATIREVEANCTGSTPLTRNRFKENFFLNLEVPLPPIKEQRWIVAKIDELAAKIQNAHNLRQQAAKETEALVNDQLRAAFSTLSNQHGTTSIGDLIIEAGYGSSEKCDSERIEEAVPVLRIPNVVSEQITLADLKYTRLSPRDQRRLILVKGDLLVVRTNGSLDLVGRSAVVDELPEPMAFASYMIRLRFHQERILPEYAQRALRHLRMVGQLVDLARTTAGQYNVSLGRLRSARMPVPPLSVQRGIVGKLGALQAEMDILKHLQAEITAELDALLPSILDKAFKGEL